MTIWEGVACLPLTGRRLEVRPPQQMTADGSPAVSLSYPLDYARYLVGKVLPRHRPAILPRNVDVTVTILKALERDLALQGCRLRMWCANEMASYISIVFKSSKVSYSVSLTALIYLLRLRHALRVGTASSLVQLQLGVGGRLATCVPALFITSLVLANKFLHDRHISNVTWSTHAGLPTAEINRGEMAFLEALGHRLAVEQTAFEKWIAALFNPVNLQNYFFGASHHGKVTNIITHQTPVARQDYGDSVVPSNQPVNKTQYRPHGLSYAAI